MTRPCRACQADHWGICARHEAAAEARNEREYDDGSADLEAGRYEREVLGL
jgi:hypothetical protein